MDTDQPEPDMEVEPPFNTQHRETSKGSENMPIEDVAALLAKLGSANKRKSWEERFGSLSIAEDDMNEQDQKEAESEQQDKKSKKKKKSEKVIKDFSMLTLEDFQFDDQE